MSEDINSVSMLIRREIEALIAVPLIKGFMEAFGKEKALEVARKVIREQALESGRFMAEMAGGNTLEDLEKILPLFSQGGALDLNPPVTEAGKVHVDVTRCGYAEMYKTHGLEEFGFLLSCGRDYALFEGFSEDIKFERTKTIMEGADICDFCLSEKK